MRRITGKVANLNTNTIQLHEGAIQDATREDRRLRDIQSRLDTQCTSNSVSDEGFHWVNTSFQLATQAETVRRQLEHNLSVLAPLFSTADQSCNLCAGDEDDFLATMKGKIQGLRHRTANLSKESQADVARQFLKDREEMVELAIHLEGVGSRAALEAKKARFQVARSLQSDHVDVEIDREIQQKLLALKSLSDDNALLLQAEIRHRFAEAREEGQNGVSMRRKWELTRWGLKRVDESIAIESQRAKQAALATIRQEINKETHAHLKVLREAREKLASRKTILDAKRIACMERKKLREKDRCQEERRKIKGTIDDWRDDQHRLGERNLLEERQHQYEEELKRLARMQTNGDRVKFRQARRVDKLAEEKAAARTLARLEEKRCEKLNRLAASVPYHETLTTISANIMKSTAATDASKYQHDKSCLSDFDVSNQSFFSEERLFSDPKFRLGHALREAGVAESNLAAAMVADLCVRPDRPF